MGARLGASSLGDDGAPKCGARRPRDGGRRSVPVDPAQARVPGALPRAGRLSGEGRGPAAVGLGGVRALLRRLVPRLLRSVDGPAVCRRPDEYPVGGRDRGLGAGRKNPALGRPRRAARRGRAHCRGGRDVRDRSDPRVSRRRATVTTHKTGTREEWLAARLDLLGAEKELTRRSDEVARRRQELPWVRIDKEYRFETDDGTASLADLFRGRSQLLIYHFMFGPDYTGGCPACSSIADGFGGCVIHLANHDVTLAAVSRAPLAKLQAYKRRMGWAFPWASSLGSDFNFDFNVSFTEEQQREGVVEYNYRRGGHAMDATPVPEPVAQFAAICGTDAPTFSRDRPGMSAFVLEDGVVYHT